MIPQESNAWVEEIIAKIRQILSTFKYQNLLSGPPSPAKVASVEGSDSAVEQLDVDQLMMNGTSNPSPCVISNIQNYTAHQLEYLFDNLSESYA